MTNFYHHDGPFALELGGELPELAIAYHTYGTLNADKSNVVWVCHALTANSDVKDWWPHTVEEGKFLDPADNFIICANILGSPYGTTAPLHVNPATGKPYFKDFPAYTIRDIVNAHRVLADALGIEEIDTLVGCSVGGFQAIEWAVMEPERFKKLALMATDAIATPWTIAIDETQRMCIEADATFGNPVPSAGRKGLAAKKSQRSFPKCTARAAISNIRVKSYAGASMHIPIMQFSTRSTPMTWGVDAEASKTRSSA